MRKRGQTEVPAVIPIAIFSLLLIAGFFYLPIMKEIVTITREVGFEANFLARDAAMVVNTLFASPSTMVVKYDKDMKWFGIQIKDKTVSIHDQTKPLDKIASFRFLPDTHGVVSGGSLAATFSGEKKRELVATKVHPLFSRVGDGIVLESRRDGLSRSLHHLDCDSGALDGFKNVFLDAAHGVEDPGYSSEDRREFETTHVWGGALKLLLSAAGKEVFYTRGQDGNRKSHVVSEDASHKKEVDFILSLHAGSNQGNVVKAYYLAAAPDDIKALSQHAGCAILNRLVDVPDLAVEGVALIPLDASQRIGGESSRYEGVLLEGTPGIILEIGSIDDDRFEGLTSSRGVTTLVESIRHELT